MMLSTFRTVISFVVITIIIIVVIVSYLLFLKSKWKKTTKKVDDFTGITETGKDILDLMIDNPKISNDEISIVLNLPKYQIDKEIKGLLEKEIINKESGSWGIFK